MWLWPLKMPTQNFLMLLLLLMRKVLTTVWSRFWSWGMVEILEVCWIILNLNFGQDFEAEVRSKILMQNFGQVFEIEVWSWLWSWRLFELLRLKFGQDMEAEFWSTSDLTEKPLVREPLGPLCLWQCLRCKWRQILKKRSHQCEWLFIILQTSLRLPDKMIS